MLSFDSKITIFKKWRERKRFSARSLIYIFRTTVVKDKHWTTICKTSSLTS